MPVDYSKIKNSILFQKLLEKNKLISFMSIYLYATLSLMILKS